MSRGYTLVEVMMSLVVLAIGAMGVYSLQAVAVHANSHARDMTEGTNVARYWMEELRKDSLLWDAKQPQTTALDRTTYLVKIKGAGLVQGAWFAPSTTPMGRELPGMGSGTGTGSGSGSGSGTGVAQGGYCGHMRLSWLRPNRVIRAEVRVFWHALGSDLTLYPSCGQGSLAAMGNDTSNVHWVYLASTLEPP